MIQPNTSVQEWKEDILSQIWNSQTQCKGISIVCDDGSIRSDPALLASLSPWLTKILESSIHLQSCSIIIPGTSIAAVKALLSLTLSGECRVNESTMKELNELMLVCKISMISTELSEYKEVVTEKNDFSSDEIKTKKKPLPHCMAESTEELVFKEKVKTDDDDKNYEDKLWAEYGKIKVNFNILKQKRLCLNPSTKRLKAKRQLKKEAIHLKRRSTCLVSRWTSYLLKKKQGQVFNSSKQLTCPTCRFQFGHYKWR